MSALGLAVLLPFLAESGASLAGCTTDPPGLRLEALSSSLAGAKRALAFDRPGCETLGRYVAPGDLATPAEIARDVYCSEALIDRLAPRGVVAVFASARLGEETPEYQVARRFSELWTRARGDLPILTAAGPGIMEGANRGATEGGGTSLGFGHRFTGPEEPMNRYVTAGYMFSDFATRERGLMSHARAAVAFPGGIGTAWELLEIMTEVQTHKLERIPIVAVGRAYWARQIEMLEVMRERGTISPEDLELVQVVDTPEEAVAALERLSP